MKAVINISGEINEKTVDDYLDAVNEVLSGDDQLEEIYFLIDSNGGIVQAADAIISHAESLRKTHGVKITTEQVGNVMSAASKLMTIGDERIGNKGDHKNIMIHLPRIETPQRTVIDSKSSRELADLLTGVEDEFVEAYNGVIKVDKDTTKNKKKIRKLMAEETFFSNTEALENGFLTKINAKATKSNLNDIKPIASYVDLDNSDLINNPNPIEMDEKQEQGIVDKVIAAFDKRKEAEASKSELVEVKAENTDLGIKYEEALKVKAEADKEVESLKTELEAKKEEVTAVISDADTLSKTVKELLAEVKAYKVREGSAADEEVQVKAEAPDSGNAGQYQAVSRGITEPFKK